MGHLRTVRLAVEIERDPEETYMSWQFFFPKAQLWQAVFPLD